MNRTSTFLKSLLVVACLAMVSVSCMRDPSVPTNVTAQPEMERYDAETDDDGVLSFQIPEFVEGDIPMVQVFMKYAATDDDGAALFPTDFVLTQDGKVMSDTGAWREMVILVLR